MQECIARLTLSAEAISWRGMRLPRPDKSGLAMTGWRPDAEMNSATTISHCEERSDETISVRLLRP